MKLLAGLEVPAQAAERTAEAIGADIVTREREEIQRAMRWDPPMAPSGPIPAL